MEIFPAIDLKDGQVVRLTQGDYNKVEVYATDPAAIARQFRQAGARNLHVVDLDGARDGVAVNHQAIRAIARTERLFIEVGGGIRDEARIATYLELGVGRVILGTVAVEDPAFTAAMIKKYGDAIAVGVDARDGKVAVKGWLETTALDSLAFCLQLEKMGLATIIYTDIARDGAMEGTNRDIYRTLRQTLGLNIIASGGISSLEDVAALREIGVHGAILGKALYTGALDLREVLAQC